MGYSTENNRMHPLNQLPNFKLKEPLNDLYLR
jgi:hypothetical protein